METITVSAPDIECDGCANAIKKSLGTVPGIAEVSVNVAAKTVTVTHDSQTAPRQTITDKLEKIGFPVAA